jgi:ABC-type uncharacterized transport system involved in gliding motility auxiliary subunit
MQKKSIFSLGSLALLLVLFVAISMLSSNLLRGLRFDPTENGLFTLSEGTRNVLATLEEPVTLYFYFSQASSREIPQIRSYARRVDELLQEFESQAAGKLTVRQIDPEPFSEEEDQAAALGLQAAPVGAAGETLYLGIAGSNTLDDVQVMPFLQPSKEKFLEYDLAKMIATLGNPERKKLGLLTTLSMQAGWDPATQSMREPWVVYEQLGQMFDIEEIPAQATELPEALDVLEARFREWRDWDKLVLLLLGRLEATREAHDRVGLLREVARIFEHEVGDLGKAFHTLRAAFREQPKEEQGDQGAEGALGDC